tara:strand:- start:773 stop:1066 length:294 start_codon:yes stop_codon:yes gene_type:complete
MAEKITVSEAALKLIEAQPQILCKFGPPGLAFCDQCLSFITHDEIAYQDENRTECQDCSDWMKLEIALDILQQIEGNDAVDNAQDYLAQVVNARKNA